MAVYSVVKTGGKQFLVKEGDTILAERVSTEPQKKLDLDVLMTYNDQTGDLQVGAPLLEKKLSSEVLEHLKGDKIRVAKFKSKVRFRKVKGFRASLSRIKVA